MRSPPVSCPDCTSCQQKPTFEPEEWEAALRLPQPAFDLLLVSGATKGNATTTTCVHLPPRTRPTTGSRLAAS